MPSKTRCLVLFIETKNFDQAPYESMRWIEFSKDDKGSPNALEKNVLALADASALRTTRSTYSLAARLTKGLPRSVNRHGRCAERLMPMRLSATTSKVARELTTKLR